MVTDAQTQFLAQGKTTGTYFQLIFQDWGKLQMLGQTLSSVHDSTSPWFWGTGDSSTILTNMMPAIDQAAYQAIMSGAYAIGSYMPNANPNWTGHLGWGLTPLSRQPYGYMTIQNGTGGTTPTNNPFDIPAYIPFTYPTDTSNQWYNDPRTSTLMSYNTWLGISQLDTPSIGSTGGFQYQPPKPETLTFLFTPAWNWPKGAGVYRPAFFNSWPFHRVACTPPYGNYVNGGMSIGGCNWSAAAPAPELLQRGRSITKPSVTIRASQSSGDRPRQPQIDVMLTIHNNGPVTAQSVTIDSITVQTLAGSGQATLISSPLPIRLTNLKPGDSITVFLKLNVPANAPRISITENGTITSGNSRAPETFKFSEAQSLFVR